MWEAVKNLGFGVLYFGLIALTVWAGYQVVRILPATRAPRETLAQLTARAELECKTAITLQTIEDYKGAEEAYKRAAAACRKAARAKRRQSGD